MLDLDEVIPDRIGPNVDGLGKTGFGVAAQPLDSGAANAKAGGYLRGWNKHGIALVASSVDALASRLILYRCGRAAPPDSF